ncbi:simple sugar transport system substrate-binding protein [Prauserella shujinwangii]|uniref:Simple sugar transport system substrate-binding protein n=1 Tax=Prauserella shujinwangii TaxID=1453103 RepID=A0A2T0LW21_9PSEU|nr:sugar ABC transporter substrate-binding protein [Prauserella shujinwangii]PRX48197.1 simple sugar transport system substrate-binding protein [Prauserella shujinwangii]
MKTRNRLLGPLALVMAGLLALAGCSSSGGKQAEEDAAGAGAGTADTPRLKVAMITHAVPGDTFWDILRKGAQAAAAKDNIELVYSANPDAGKQANLVQNAIDQNVDGIAVTLAKPDALTDVVRKAQDAGIPVVGFNSGLNEWKEAGLLGYFGQDETVAGEAFGRRLNEEGAKHVLCVIQEQGHVALEARCAGVKKAFQGKAEILYVNGADMPSVQSTIQAKLQQDAGIDYIATLGAPFALAAVQSASDAGSAAKIATFDTNKDLVQAIKDGDVQFAVDQQPYLQGYLAVDAIWLYQHNGNYMGGREEPVLTGPAFITKDNIDQIAEFAANGTR